MKVMISVFLVFLCSSSFGNDYKHMISGQPAAVIDVDRSYRRNTTSFALTGSYSYQIVPMLQIEGSLAFAATEYATLRSVLGISVGPVLNIFCSEKNKLQNAFFITPKIGFAHYELEYDTTDATFITLEMGKRFALNERISWNVSIIADHYLTSGFDPNIDFRINLFGLSVYL